MATASLLTPTVWQSLRFEWLWVYHGRVPVTERWSKEITVPAGWFWVEAGLARIRAGGREIRVKPGQSFFSAPGTRQQWFAQGTKLLSVGFRCDWPSGGPVFQAGLNVALSRSRGAALEEASRELFRQVHGGRAEVTYPEAIQPQAATLKAWSLREAGFRRWFEPYVSTLEKMGVQPQPPDLAGRSLGPVLKKLEGWPLEEPLQLSKLAAGTRLGTRRLHDLLREHLGMTAQAWLERRRLEAARQQLAAGQAALKEIAYALGFRHPPHFTAWFKRHTGMTPTAFRAAGGLSGA